MQKAQGTRKGTIAFLCAFSFLASAFVAAQAPGSRAQLLLEQGKTDWFAMRTRSAEQALIAAAKNPATAAEAHYWLGRIYDFKGKAEGVIPGFHEQISYRPRAEAEFKAAGAPRPEWILEADGFDNSLKAADASIAKLQANAASSPADIRAAIEYRIKLRPDPMSHSAGANLLLSRNADLPFVLRLAAAGKIAGERFIKENEDSYKLDGKVQASLDRNAATFADIAGWALFLQGDISGAEARLAEAARLFRNVDATNQLHLAELSVKKNDLDTARDHYVAALGLAGITAPQREQAKTALAEVQKKAGENPAEFDKWLATTLDVNKEERRRALVSSMQGRKLPALVLKDLQGNNVDLRAERGNVVLLNFFAAW
jgi:hypothetical protein